MPIPSLAARILADPMRASKVLVVYCLARLIGPLAYDRRYLQGRWFAHPSADGWKWVVRGFFLQKIMGWNRSIRWPVTGHTLIASPQRIHFDANDLNIFQHGGCYFQGAGGEIQVGKGTWIAPNVGLITENHDLADPDKRGSGGPIILGEKCWIGMNAVVLPGVTLGPHTVVAAGAVVTCSFPEGHCLVGGVPARLIRSTLEPGSPS